ncbi:MAG: CHAT domain-containing tetratricopeptide repeat protein [Cyanobacteria bacterium P01_G01_bin.54]
MQYWQISSLIVFGLSFNPGSVSEQALLPTVVTQRVEDAELERAAELFNTASDRYEEEDFAAAIPLAEEALEIYRRRLGNKHLVIARILNDLAVFYELQGRYREAEPLHQEALRIRRHLRGNQHPDVAQSLNNLALLYDLQGRYGEAEPLYLESLIIWREHYGDEDLEVALSLNNRAELYRNQGRYQEAEPLHQEALAIRRKVLANQEPDAAPRDFAQSLSDLTQSLNNLALLYETQGKYTEAEPLYNDALTLLNAESGDMQQLANTLNNLALLYEAQEKYAESESLYHESLALYYQVLDPEHPDIATSWNNLATLYKLQGRFGEAESLYLKALEVRQKGLGKDHPLVADGLENLGALSWAQQNDQQALNYFSQGQAVREQNLQQALSSNAEAHHQDLFRNKLGFSRDAAIALHLSARPTDETARRLAFNTILQYKGRILDARARANRFKQLRDTLPRAWQATFDQWQQQRQDLANRYFSPPQSLSAPEHQQHQRQLQQLTQETNQLEAQLARVSAPFRSATQTVTLETLQQQLPTNSQLIEIVKYRQINPILPRHRQQGQAYRYAAYILNATGIPIGIDLGNAAEIERLVDIHHGNLRSDNTPLPQVQRSSQALAQRILHPLEPHLKAHHRLFIAPDSTLNLLPFETLTTRDGEFLIKTHAITYLTSGRDLIRRVQDDKERQQAPVIMGDPYLKKNPDAPDPQPQEIDIAPRSTSLSQIKYAPLIGTRREAKAIAALFNVEAILGVAASESAVAQVNRPSILHIASHGFFAPHRASADQYQNSMLLSGLVLAGLQAETNRSGQDGLLTAYEMASLNLYGTQLAVLSACDTGRGRLTAGDGIYGLRRALVLAGTESQVVSLWKVADDATQELMVRYYQKLKAGEGRSEALRLTQLEMLGSQDWSHPYYWAAFIPSGNPEPLEL